MLGDIGGLLQVGKEEIMKLYLLITKMSFEEDAIEHNIIRGISIKEFLAYDEMVELPDDDKFIKDTLKRIYKKDKKGEDTEEIESILFDIREKESWWGFPLYELKDGKIVPFKYTKYAYFANTKRRNMLTSRINGISGMYTASAEAKITRKTLKYIMDTLKIPYPDFFRKYNDKIESLINKIPKN